MNSTKKFACFAFAALLGAGAWAQGAGPGPGPGGPRQGGPACCGPNDTMGWSMMTRQERTEHRDKIRSMKTYEECKTYVEQHHAQMAARAKDKGRTMPAQPRGDACARLKK
jgi:hypothetical protein